ncbi:RNA-guided endonuclease TnpB family protein [Neobacillus sp. NPDC093127]|uniref:RNA-guided endonuclease TnpB family protein n=1 Tax=Neobacillus sp. NPDC093127 TaxID=3364296 RepID=UPI00380DECF0
MSKKQDSSFVLTLPMNATHFDMFHFDKVFEVSRRIQNACLGEILKRNRLVQDNKHYCKNIRCIKAVKNKIQNSKNKKEKMILETELRSLYNKQKEIERQFGLIEYAIHDFVAPMKRHFEGVLDINTAQKIASRAWKAYEKKRYGSAKKVYFKKYGTMTSIEDKTNKSGITFREVKGQYLINVIGTKVSVTVKEMDIYAKEAFLNRKNIKYCRIIRKMIRGKMRYFVQLIMKGIPPAKRNKNTGLFKVRLGKGRTGIDPGIQTMAIVSDHLALLRELAPNVETLEREKRLILRKMDRSKRTTNPQKFNPDGTIKVGSKDKWSFSANYIKLRNKLQDIQRKQAAKRKQSHCRLANVILRTVDEFFVETMHYQGLQIRAKETKISEKTGKFQRKKRFGKSIANKAPALFVSILEYKCRCLNAKFNKINTWTAQASQYNHESEAYEKKKLHQRWSQVGNFFVQRDLYSAFLIKNIDESLDKIDKTLCDHTFLNFIVKHDLEIQRLKLMKPSISSMGIKS